MKSNDHDVVQGEEEKKKNRGKRFYSFTVHLGYILPSYKNSLQSFSRLHWFAFKVFFFFHSTARKVIILTAYLTVSTIYIF